MHKVYVCVYVLACIRMYAWIYVCMYTMEHFYLNPLGPGVIRNSKMYLTSKYM